MIQRFKSGHDAFIHDVAFDYFGQRLATCSVDRSIRVWKFTSVWELEAVLPEAHTAPVHKLAWAHPEFGQVLASCSADCYVNIFEEIVTQQGKKWVKRASQVDAKDEVADIQFAPPSNGLKLATCSKDGVVRVYEAVDVVNLAMWPLQQEFTVSGSGGCTSLSWNSSSAERQMIAVGTKLDGAAIWGYHPEARRWVKVCVLCGGHAMDVDWAPNIGRGYHLIAVASGDGIVRIFKVKINAQDASAEVTVAAELKAHKGEVWRVSWNLTGTILASSGDDGKVLLWKCAFKGEWELAYDATKNVNESPIADIAGGKGFFSNQEARRIPGSNSDPNIAGGAK
jgi:nucleoporin SEH1